LLVSGLGPVAEQIDLTDEASIAALADRLEVSITSSPPRPPALVALWPSSVTTPCSSFMTGVSLGIDGGEPLV
jgi:hypothetical protein